jgi:hypothetical protein
LSGEILIAADNSYEVDLNGFGIGSDSNEYNFRTGDEDLWTLDVALSNGMNTLDFMVDNWHVIGGLMYTAEIQYCLDEEWHNETNGTEDDWPEWEGELDEDYYYEDCDTGILTGTWVVENDDGSGILEGLVLNLDGEVIGEMYGEFNEDGFLSGVGGDLDGTTDVEWTAVGQDGRFVGLWRMVDGEDSGVLAGHYYKANEDGSEGTFVGAFMSEGCDIIVPEYIIVPNYIVAGNESVGISPVPTPIPGDELVGISPVPTPIPGDDKVVEEVEDESEEGKVTLPEVGKEEQLLVAGAGTGTTLSLLGLALRRRLFGSTL